MLQGIMEEKVDVQKKCIKCQHLLPLSRFRIRKDTKRYNNVCIPCTTNKQLVWAKNNKESRIASLKRYNSKPENRKKYLAWARKKKYGITIEETNLLLKKQDNKCGICKKDISIDFCIDHCHMIGIVRGILCDACNGGLGLFKDDPILLKEAADYLERSYVI